MKLPPAVPPRYLGASDLKSYTQERRPEPVESSNGTNSALYSTVEQQLEAAPSRSTLDGKTRAELAERPARLTITPQPVMEERRRQDRRQAKQAVFLDTRQRRGRRRTDGKVIDYEI